MFNKKKPTTEMLGRWQPWHDGHTELFKRALQKTGQLCIMYRDVGGSDAGVEGQSDNPFQFEEVKKNIIEGLKLGAFHYITKPFDIHKIIPIIHNSVSFYRKFKGLSEKNKSISRV